MLKHYNPQDLHIYTDTGRFYGIEGKQYPGVGTIQNATNPAEAKRWEEWRKLPENAAKSEAAKERGTQFHQIVEEYFTSPLWDDRDDEQVSKSSILPYWQSVQPVLPSIDNPQLIESAVWHDIGCYAGTVDLVAEYKGKLSIIDWKTSERPKNEVGDRYPLQLAAYCGAINRMYETKIRQGVIVIANSKTDCQVYKFDLGDFWKIWISKLQQYWQMKAPDPFAEQVLKQLEEEYFTFLLDYQ